MKNLFVFVKNLLSFSNSFILRLLLVLVIGLTVSLTIIYKEYAKEKERASRLNSNVLALQTDLRRFTSSDGLQAAEINTLTVTVSELKEQNSSLVSELKTLKIKPKEVTNIHQVSTGADYLFSVKAKDTIALIDTVSMREKRYSYNDSWIKFEMTCDESAVADSCKVKVTTVDSLLIIQHTKVKRFLWWTWKRYSGTATVKNYNPYSQIKSFRNIDVIK